MKFLSWLGSYANQLKTSRSLALLGQICWPLYSRYSRIFLSLHFFKHGFRNQFETCDSSEEGFRELETPDVQDPAPP